jgi:hypothetical protein
MGISDSKSMDHLLLLTWHFLSLRKGEGMDPVIKVTKIKNRWHARLWYNNKPGSEMACDTKLDIGWICRELMRWWDKCGGSSYHAHKARERHNSFKGENPPVGNIWEPSEISKEHRNGPSMDK